MNRRGRTEYRLYLGMTYTDQAGEIQDIDPERVAHFIETVVIPILPDFTLINALGAWEGIIEPSMILTHIGTAESRTIIKTIGESYKAWFQQEAVLLTETLIMVETL